LGLDEYYSTVKFNNVFDILIKEFAGRAALIIHSRIVRARRAFSY
jgi:hypothetical protein